MPEEMTADKSAIKGSFSLSSHVIVAVLSLVAGGGTIWGVHQVSPNAPKAQVEQVSSDSNRHAERIAVLETEIREFRGQLARIDRKLDVLIERKVSAQ